MMQNEVAYNLLRLLETPGLGVVKTNSIIDLAGNNQQAFLDFFKEETRLRSALTEKQLDAFCSTEEQVVQVWQRLIEKEVKFLTALDEGYPPLLHARLEKHTPPLLMILGNPQLLGKPSAGFCGSRKASEKGLATAHDCADQLARQGINIVSGYAAGVDMATHRAALECGGTTTLVLCEGILHFAIKRDLKDLWDWEKIVVVSEFLPGVPWSVRNAMQRNKTICALTSSMILIESTSKGGSIEAGRSCLKMGVPLFAPVYAEMPETAVGNRELLNQGARKLLKNSKTNRANMTDVLSAIFQDQPTAPVCAQKYKIEKNLGEQLSLFENKGDYK
ncbi:MAG: DNA-processing protein DprA [Deltaproteobacteria bacterium]|nr:DNA-processing protein DprA [Deltaproteobacteria bacterium]